MLNMGRNMATTMVPITRPMNTMTRGSIMLVKPDVKELDELAKLIEAKKLKCVVSETVPLAEAKRAHELSETGHTQGKIVLQVVK